MFDSLAKNKIVADKSFNRWMVPPAALMIHLSIGMIYGFSIFWPELTKLVGTECGASDAFSGITANPLIGGVVVFALIAVVTLMRPSSKPQGKKVSKKRRKVKKKQ